MHILENQDKRVIHAALSDYKYQLERKNDGTDYGLLIERINKLRDIMFKDL